MASSTTFVVLLLLLSSTTISIIPACFASRHSKHKHFPSSKYRPSGFTATIIHRDSPKSPLYNPNVTRYERLKASILHREYLGTKAINTNLRSADLEYVMEFSIGTPEIRTYSLIDTGSTLTWIQCAPCIRCFYQKRAHIFNPSKSSTYKNLTCDEGMCKTLRGGKACPPHGDHGIEYCQYLVRYGDKSTSSGVIARETIHFLNEGEEASFQNFVFGCGHDNFDISSEYSEGTPGIIGLSRDKESLLTQLSYTRFLHCFGDIHDEKAYGFAKFGEDAEISLHSTPMEFKTKDPYYYMILEGMSVGDVRLPIQEELFTAREGYPKDGVIIDSGTPYTRLNTPAFNILTNELEHQMPKMKRILGGRQAFNLCFRGGISNIQSAPIITLHFKDLNLELPTWNAWEKTEDGSYCLAMFSHKGGSMLGSYQLQNFKVGYDLLNKVYSFDPYVCALEPLRH